VRRGHILRIAVVSLMLAIGVDVCCWRLGGWLSSLRVRRLRSQCQIVRAGIDKRTALAVLTAYDGVYVEGSPPPRIAFKTGYYQCVVQFDEQFTRVKGVASESITDEFNQQEN